MAQEKFENRLQFSSSSSAPKFQINVVQYVTHNKEIVGKGSLIFTAYDVVIVLEMIEDQADTKGYSTPVML